MKLRSFLFALTCLALPAHAGAPVKAVVTKPEDLLVGLPHDVMIGLRAGSNTMLEACTKAAITVNANAESRVGSFKVTVRTVDAFQRIEEPGVKRYRLHAVVELMRFSGITMKQEIMALPDETEYGKLSKLTPGTKVTVTGKINHAEVLPRTNAELHIDLLDAKLK